MLARIESVGLHKPTGFTFAEITLWPGPNTTGPPTLRNDFLIEQHSNSEVPRTDGAGRYLTESGQAVIPFVEIGGDWRPRPEDPADPWQRESLPTNLAEQLVREVIAYARRNPPPGDHRGVPGIEVVAADLPQELADLVGEVITID